MREEIISSLEKTGVIAILRGIPSAYALPVAEALYAGGIRLLEFTYEQSAPETWEQTAQTVGAVQKAMRGKLSVGAGTVTSPSLVELTARCGGSFAVSPDTNAAVIARTRELGLVSVPGAMTPTEVQTAHLAGADFVKLFPACTLGADYIRLLHAPLSHVKLLAVGGVTPENAASFLRAGAVGVAVGGALVRKEWLAQGDFSRITAAARDLFTAMRK